MREFGRNPQGQSPPEFGINAPVVHTKQFDLTNARDLVEVPIGGTALWCITASDLNAWIDVRFNDQLRSLVRYQMGLFIRGTAFSRIYVSNDAQAGKTLDLLYVTERDLSRFEISNPAIAYNSVGLANAQVLESIADVTCNAAATTLILAANANRRCAMITNLSTNISTLRIGDAGAAATNGLPIAPGTTVSISTTDDIYAYNPGVAQNVAVTYTED